MKRHFTHLLIFAVFCGLASLAQAQTKLPKLLIRLDDIGMNHSVNMAAKAVAETGMPVSVSIQFACPWYQEAVAVLKDHPNVCVGIHLTLTAEWKYYRWGPVLGPSVVPSLVDSLGYFHTTERIFSQGKYNIDEVEKELSAQIERALHSGIKITYMDPHMGVALSNPQLRDLTEKLARKYHLAISTLSNVTYYGETYKEMWGEPIATKKSAFMDYINHHLSPDRPNLMVIHSATPSPEMDAMIDENSRLMRDANGHSTVSRHRQTELNMILSTDFTGLNGKKFELTNYAELLKGKDISNPKATKVIWPVGAKDE